MSSGFNNQDHQNHIVVRKLDQGDLTAVAGIHIVAFPDSALTRLGLEPVRRYYDWQLSGPHEVTALAAMESERLIGFCFGGVFRGAMSGFLQRNRTYLLRQVITHPWLLANPIFRDRLTTARRILGRKSGPTTLPLPRTSPRVRSYGILSIAVVPECQGRGAGKLLIRECEFIARRGSFSEMHLTVNPANAQAITFYERLNWVKDNRGDIWEGRMWKALE